MGIDHGHAKRDDRFKNRADAPERPASLRKGFFSYVSLSIVIYRSTRFLLDEPDREYDQINEDKCRAHYIPTGWQVQMKHLKSTGILPLNSPAEFLPG